MDVSWTSEPPSCCSRLDVAQLCAHRLEPRLKRRRRRRGERRLTRPVFGHPRREVSLALRARPLPLGRLALCRRRVLEMRRHIAQQLRRRLEAEGDRLVRLALTLGGRAELDGVSKVHSRRRPLHELRPVEPRPVGRAVAKPRAFFVAPDLKMAIGNPVHALVEMDGARSRSATLHIAGCEHVRVSAAGPLTARVLPASEDEPAPGWSVEH
mmetsp:Transcript_14455/g.46373  ORF Transcript_14455/g.46373 Transcript_14455/m.46373 type:complete len:211 (-) Transcript_14455:53-685(-)